MGSDRKIPLFDRLTSPSTRAFFQEGQRTPGYTWRDALHGYVYARWPYLYIGIGKGDHRIARYYLSARKGWQRLFRGLHPGIPPQRSPVAKTPRPDRRHDAETPSHTYADGYHGKVVPLQAATQLVMVNEPVRLPDLEQVIPYVRARDLVLKNPDHIIALECPCRSAKAHPCLPLDVCLIVGEPFAGFVAEHHPKRARWVTPEEAVAILKAEDERGHVHHAFFKDAMLGRFYAICNCCACCCGAMGAHQRGTPMLASSGYVCQVDESLCIACGTCSESCQFSAIRLGSYSSVVDERACMGCGVCVNHCEQGALSLRREVARGQPLEIFDMLQMPG